jgi:hypothetical protein
VQPETSTDHRESSDARTGRVPDRADPGQAVDEAPTLADLLAEGPLDPARAVALVGDVAEALQAARARGDVRPNVDPARIVVERTRSGEHARLDASGVASPVGEQLSSGVGLQYLPPEVIRGEAISPNVDVYSLAALLYHCLTGSVPFPSGRDRAVLFWHLHAPRPRATAARPSLRPTIDPVLERGMAVDSRERHPTSRALVEDVRHALGVASTPAQQPAAAPNPPVPVPAARDSGATASEALEWRPLAPTSRGRTRRTLRRLAVVFGVLALTAAALVALAFVVAGGLDDAPPQSSVANAGPLELAVPTGWLRDTPAAVPAALPVRRPIVLAPPGRGDRLIAGTASPSASVALLRRLRPSPDVVELVSVGGVRAWRYRAAKLFGAGGPVAVYLVPTDRDVAVVTCLAHGAARSAWFAPRCEQAVGSLRLSAGRIARIRPTKRQTAGVARAFRRLNAARSRYPSQIFASPPAVAQATAALALARAHRRAAADLRSLRLTRLGRPAAQPVVRALERTGAAYRSLARAVQADARRYAVARRAALAGEVRIRRARRGLRLVGYPD